MQISVRLMGSFVAIALCAPALANEAIRKFSYTNVVTVAGVDSERRQLIVQDGWRGQDRIRVDADTSIQDARGQSIPLDSLEPWDRVAIDARKEHEGTRDGSLLIADRVQLVIGSPGGYRADATRAARDALVRGRVVERLARSRSLQGSDIWVSIHDGHVTLRGLVADEIAHARAMAIARRTPGVRRVADELRMDPTLRDWLQIAKKDDVLAREVAERIAATALPGSRIEEDWLFGWEVEGDSFELGVEADMGTITLVGRVPSAEDEERVLRVARRTHGVRSVQSELTHD